MTDQRNGRHRSDVPDSTSIGFIGAICTLILVVLVCFSSGLYYEMGREAGVKPTPARSPLLETTVTAVRLRLEGWNKRRDEEADTEHLTSPIQLAMRLVMSELRSGQGH